jgi:hypothetical protein
VAGGSRIHWPQIQDADVRALVQHLQRRQKYPLKDGEKPAAYDRVIGWRGSAASELIEAFLLAADTCDAVAGDLCLPVEEVALYARLYCDLHDAKGRRRPAVIMRVLADLEGMAEPDAGARLRKIAITGGINALRRVLQGSTATAEPSLDQLVETELTRRLHAGELRTGDLVRLQANGIARQRLALEVKDDGPPKLTQSLELVRHVLGLTAPQIVLRDDSPDSVTSSNEAIRGRLASQKSITATPLTDEPDKGYEALTKLMGKHFKGG